MYQTEIKFFWPLTEQLPLDLNYKECERPSLSYPLNSATAQTYTISNGGTWTTGLVASHLNIDVDTTVIKTKGKPPLIRRGLYKLLGLKWESK
jgi:hypothetical protein